MIISEARFRQLNAAWQTTREVCKDPISPIDAVNKLEQLGLDPTEARAALVHETDFKRIRLTSNFDLHTAPQSLTPHRRRQRT